MSWMIYTRNSPRYRVFFLLPVIGPQCFVPWGVGTYVWHPQETKQIRVRVSIVVHGFIATEGPRELGLCETIFVPVPDVVKALGWTWFVSSL